MKQLKKLLIFILITILIAGLSSCALIKKYAPNAVEEEVKPAGYIETKTNELFEYDVFRDHISITGYLGKDTVVVVPDKIDEKTVTTIAALAFYENNIAVNITLPQTITTIEAKAFYFCKELTELVIPNSVTSIGEQAFSFCSALVSITLPTGLTEIPDYAFNNCLSLKSIVIPNTVTKIGMRAFSYCTSLTRIELPSLVVSIGENAFLNCTAMLYAIIPDSVTTIGTGVFKNCTLLTVVTTEGTTINQYCNDNSFTTTTERPADEVSDISSDVSDTSGAVSK